ncbi:MAG TPA: methyltransferase [Pyrinomonadaceae bacterium]|nr:methyltransferase [Pyrinomonadaceae bacterium]
MKSFPPAAQPDLIFCLHASAAFQYFNAGVELGVFDLFEAHPSLTLSQVAESTDLSLESTRCLLFGLSALNLVIREGDFFYNSAAISLVFKRGEWKLLQAMTRFQAHIVYLGLNDFVKSLKEDRNAGLERIEGQGETLYQRLLTNPAIEKIFFEYMETYSDFAIKYLIKNLDLSSARHVLDVGGGMGRNAIAIASRYPNAQVTLLDLQFVIQRAEPLISQHGLSERIKLQPCDITKEEFPGGQDCILFIHQLVIWSHEENIKLLKKAFTALNPEGRVVIFSSVADNDETGPLMAALDTAYFRAVAAGDGMIYPWKDYEQALLETGFKNVEYIRCDSWTPHGIIVGYK